MLRGIFALFFRSLRGDTRSVWVHVSWMFLLLVIYALMWFAQWTEKFVGAPGLMFFRTVLITNAVFMTMLGISYFSSAISEEKEEDTLGLMTMAGISPLGILLGKSTTRLFQAALLLAVHDPLSAMADTDVGLLEQVLASVETDSQYVRGILGDLVAPPAIVADSAASSPGPRLDDLFQIIVDCRDEADQRTLYERLTADGRKCRLVML